MSYKRGNFKPKFSSSRTDRTDKPRFTKHVPKPGEYAMPYATHLAVQLTDINYIKNGVATDIKPYNDEYFTNLKEKLMKAKSMQDKYRAEEPKLWTDTTNAIDLYRDLRNVVARDFGAQNVTNAWLKYYEIVEHYGLFHDIGGSKITAFLNAELPGAGLCAVSHYAHDNNYELEWYGSSLILGEMEQFNQQVADKSMLEDKFKLFENYPDRWLMGKKRITDGVFNNGDVTSADNLLDFEKQLKAKHPQGVDFYAHDAGIDVSKNFNEQEMENARIHFGCAIAGLLVLKNGGMFVAKQYTYFDTFTWNALLLYASCFREFYICKPLTSKPQNSEVYLIGKYFKGIADETKTVLLNRLRNWEYTPLLPIDVFNSKDLTDLEQFATLVFGQQIEFLLKKVQLMEKYRTNMWSLKAQLSVYADERIADWLKTYKIKKIEESDLL